MSYTEIYKFKKDGNAKRFARIKNAFHGAMAIWTIIEKRYLPKYIPIWAMGDTSQEYSRTYDFTGAGLEEIWNLFDGNTISKTDKIALGSTFDNVVVMKEDLPELLNAFRNFEGETSLKEQADAIEDAFNNDDDLLAIAWNQTSINGDAWKSKEIGFNEDGEEIYLPYNLLKHDKHWDLFKELI